MRSKTRNRLWSAMLWTAIVAALVGIVATARAFDASILLPVMDAGGRLPAGYTECEYLESTGTQYIDTGYTPNDATEVSCKWIGSVGGRLYGIYDVSAGFTAILGSDGGAAGWIYGSQIASLFFDWDVIYSTVQNADGVQVDGVLQYSYTSASFTSPESMYLFAQSGRTPFFTGRIFACVIKDDGVVVRDFVPALDGDGVPCMYDLVDKIPYYNAGTGTFVYQELQ